jgi:2-oxoglutarate ferredoxin oxidoreductase subunit alpha
MTVKSLQKVTIHFAGDSGDGIQLAGSQFTNTTALAGNDLSTFPDFPAEIRAPIGTVSGVSGFQIHFGSVEIDTPGGRPDVLVAMNAAAYRKNIPNLKAHGVVIANTAGFDKRNLRLAGYPEEENPLNHKPEGLQFYEIDITKLNREALKDLKMSPRDKDRSRNMFALGFTYFLYSRELAPTLQFFNDKFAAKPEVLEANVRSLKAGYHYGDTIEALQRYRVEKARLPKGEYRNVTGNQALALGLIAAAQKAQLDLFYGGYPITPASDILHELARHKNFGVKTFQAEDEIAAITACIGAAFGGSLAVTATSGPGMALKTEGLGLALMLELPMVIVNVQRGGPSTGLPTKTEQSDLLQAVYGRNGEAPLPVIAASSPADCFNAALEAAKMAVEHMTPVILLSDGYLANGSEPWAFPKAAQLPAITPPLVKANAHSDSTYQPYQRNHQQVRDWALPGTPGLEHRLGGLEKEDLTGNVSYNPENHQKMVQLRAAKVAAVAQNYLPLQLDQGPPEGDVLVLGWGNTKGAIKVAVSQALAQGLAVSQLHLRHLHPLPSDLGPLLKGFKKILVPELNNGQLVHLLRDQFLVDAQAFDKIKGQPFLAEEILTKINQMMDHERA